MTSALDRPDVMPPARAAEAPLVTLRDVFCVHRTSEGDAAALRGASLHVGHGELVCVIGPSGAGKSTLLRVIAGLERPVAGDALLGGVDIGRLAERRRARLRRARIGFLGQDLDDSLAPELRVRDAVALPLALRGSSRAHCDSRVRELLELVGLRDRERAYPAELSGGERQRVALCAAVAHRPALLLADEPTGELDADAARGLRELIGSLVVRHAMAAVIVSHDPLTTEIASRTLVIRDGRVAEDRRAGRGALIVDPDGWVRLPPELRSAAGIEERAVARIGPDGLTLSAASRTGSRPPADGALPAPARGPAQPGFSPARVCVAQVAQSRGRGGGRKNVLDAFSAEFPPGRLTVVRGRSGSGKTTLLRLIAGLDRPEAGAVMLDDQAISSLDVEARARLRASRIGYLQQEPLPVEFLSATENVVLGLALRGWTREAAAERAAAALHEVGLTDRARQRVGRLSAGERQRVALARALAGARGLLLLDEPSSRLDRTGAASIAELLAEAATVGGQTVICATHDEQLVARADHLIDLEGKMTP